MSPGLLVYTGIYLLLCLDAKDRHRKRSTNSGRIGVSRDYARIFPRLSFLEETISKNIIIRYKDALRSFLTIFVGGVGRHAFFLETHVQCNLTGTYRA